MPARRKATQRARSRIRGKPDHLAPRESALALFNAVLAACIIVIVIAALARGAGSSERWDQLMYLGCGTVAIAFGAYATAARRPPATTVLPVMGAIVGLLLGIGAIEEHPEYPSEFLRTLWGGWGPIIGVATATLAFSGAIWRVLEWATLSWLVRRALSLLAIIVCVCAALSLWQTQTSLIDPGSAEYYINELLAPLAGHVPYGDFVPQYQTLYAWMLLPFLDGGRPDQAVQIGVMTVSVLGIIAVGIGVWLAHLSLGRRSLTLAVLLVVPLTCVVPFPTRPAFTGSIAAQLSALPTRILPGMVIAATALPAFTAMREPRTLWWRFAAIGALGGLYVWNSQDFGVAANVAVAFVLIVLPFPSWGTRIRAAATWLAGLGAGFALYPALLRAMGKELDPATLFFFVRQFGSGFGAEPIQVPGPVLAVLPLIAATAIASIHLLWRVRSMPSSPSVNAVRHAATTAALLGTWSALGFVYYLNRSFASGQMQVLFLPTAVAVAALLGALAAAPGNAPAKASANAPANAPATDADSPGLSSSVLGRVPIALMASLLIANVLATPNPLLELRRLTRSSATQSWPEAQLAATIGDARTARAYAEQERKSLGYFGEGANYVQLVTDVPSANLFNNPFDLLTGVAAPRLACQFVNQRRPELLVISDAARAVIARFPGQAFCGTYSPITVSGIRDGYLLRRVE
jgi:hypothetical protein